MADREHRLTLRRSFSAPAEMLFKAWTEVEQLKRWWGPEGFSTPVAEVDLRVGGEFCFHMQSPQGEVHVVKGVFREIDPPRRLVYSWIWQRDDPAEEGETEVSIDFEPRGEQTDIVLTHRGFATAEVRDMHNQGWNGSLDSLGQLLADQ